MRATLFRWADTAWTACCWLGLLIRYRERPPWHAARLGKVTQEDIEWARRTLADD